MRWEESIAVESVNKVKSLLYRHCRRCRRHKTHWIDAAAAGLSTPILKTKGVTPLLIKAAGLGSRQGSDTDKFEFPCRWRPKVKFVNGFQTGDIVKAVVTKGRKIGTYQGRVEIRSTGSFNIQTSVGLIQGISHRYCKAIHKKDGYGYLFPKKLDT